jgi:hypothetical protein
MSLLFVLKFFKPSTKFSISSTGLYDLTSSSSLICVVDFSSSCGGGFNAGLSLRRGRCDPDAAVAAAATGRDGTAMLVWRDISGAGDTDVDGEGEIVVQRGIVVGGEVLARLISADDANGFVRESKSTGVCRGRLRLVTLPFRKETFFAQADAGCWKKARMSVRCALEKLASPKRPDCKFDSIVFGMGSVMISTPTVIHSSVIRAHQVSMGGVVRPGWSCSCATSVPLVLIQPKMLKRRTFDRERLSLGEPRHAPVPSTPLVGRLRATRS